ncbi:uncharacterized protein PG986_001073 [Apiospora aurea]|uniref:Uncharacterized protein n=1 Tax=Apiospora aurea TaxID=335848 RepID=A0ABR1QWT4_9PEZI
MPVSPRVAGGLAGLADRKGVVVRAQIGGKLHSLALVLPRHRPNAKMAVEPPWETAQICANQSRMEPKSPDGEMQ